MMKKTLEMFLRCPLIDQDRMLQFFKEALEESDEKRLMSLLCTSGDYELTVIKNILDSNTWILPRVCELGSTQVLQLLLNFQMDINSIYHGKTGLQFGCQKGHADVVTLLLRHGAIPKQTVWDEDSEFYLATLHGMEDVVAALENAKPEFVSDESVRYCLFYAACKGGHLKMMDRWKTPGTDVNRAVDFVSHLTKCEYQYPMFAACSGDHYDVAKSLIIDEHAAITEEICSKFPVLITKLVRSLCQTSSTAGKLNFEMSHFNVEYVMATCFQPESVILYEETEELENENEPFIEGDTTDIRINLSHNKIRSLPDNVLWNLPGLTFLNVSYNPLSIIHDPASISTLNSNWMTTLDLSHCELEKLSVHVFTLPFLEDLNLSYNKLSTLNGVADCSVEWRCGSLIRLDVSHNLLTCLPADLQVCMNMENLTACYNQLTTACSPWQCPMKTLNLSNNELKEFVPSADQFWSKTLRRLHLQYNQLDELSGSIVSMKNLTYLDVSNNKIWRLPADSIWSCPLVCLNLSNNQLGAQKTSAMNETNCPEVVLPDLHLRSSVMELYLAYNGLKSVPSGIGNMSNLSVLDLSGNRRIKELPHDLGKLRKLLVLKLDGVTVDDKELQALISSLDCGNGKVSANDVVIYLEKKRRECINPNIMKMVVLGCKNKNGHCLVQKLTSKGKRKDTHDHKYLTVTQWPESDGGWKFPLKATEQTSKKSMRFEIWELPELEITPVIQPCFLTLNSLYLILHDANLFGDDFHSILERISSIQACVLRPKILVVCAYTDKAELKRLEGTVKLKTETAFPKVRFVSVVFDGSDNFDVLRKEILSAAADMNDAAYEKEQKLQDRLVPSEFLKVVNYVKEMKHDICRMGEFMGEAKCSKEMLEDGMDKHLKLHEFLLQVGAMLHYNIHMGELTDCVILNPTWLFDVLRKFLQSLTEGKFRKARLPVATVREKVKDMLPQDYDYFPAFVKLLEAFNIGVRITNGSGNEILLVPSQLPEQPPEFHIDTKDNGLQAARLYLLPSIPPALWSHVIPRLIVAFERFSPTKWKLGEKKSYSGMAVDKTKSFRMSCKHSSLKGLHIANKNIQFWRTGVMMYHNQGFVVVEEVVCKQSESPLAKSGILITVRTTDNSGSTDTEDTYRTNLNKLAVIGIVRDELEEILELFNPKFRDPSEQQLKSFALCPHCHSTTPGSGEMDLTETDPHFIVRDCTQMLLWKDNIACEKGPTSLEQLVPEFLFLELPSELRLSTDDIEMSSVKLGHGMAGTVTKGTYQGIEVAIKLFHNPTVRPRSVNSEDPIYPNVADYRNVDVLSQSEKDICDTEQAKISTAFSEVRGEVGILSKLSHNCIVKFIGVCVRPHLLLVMELAPLGSLRGHLEKMLKEKYPDPVHGPSNSDSVVTNKLFSKDLTFKIIFQIGCGLSYLHKNNIIYRDLKPDNILVMSMEVNAPVNVKLSDYGISKFATLQGLTGLFGTVGYMAPEIMTKQSYTEMVDIYSYAIVMLETLTGIPPLVQGQNAFVSAMIHSDTKPMHIKDVTIRCNFPFLEYLMMECWNPSMNNRPFAHEVVKQMKQDEFLLLHDCVWLQEAEELTCMFACETAGRWNIWLSESRGGNDRHISVYDVESSCFIVHRKSCPGSRVISMAKTGWGILLACQEQNFLEAIVRGSLNKFDITHSVKLDAYPTVLLTLSHTLDCAKANGNVVVIGHGCGYITSCVFKHSHTKPVEIYKTQLHSKKSVTKMCSISQSLIAIACGMEIFFCEVKFQTHATVRGRKNSLAFDMLSSSSVSLRAQVDGYKPIACMVSVGSDIWCALEGDPNIMRIDSEHRKITQLLSLSWDPVCDTVRVDELEQVTEPHIRQAVDTELVVRTHRPERNTLPRETNPSTSEGDDDVFIPVSEPARNITLSAVRRQGGDLTNHTESDCLGEDSDDERDPYVCIKTDSDLISRSVPNRNNMSGAADADEIPPLPPRISRQRVIRRKYYSMPSLPGSDPPPIPHRQKKDIIVTSLQQSSDILVVGTDCGGCVLLPYNLDLSLTQFTLLRHLTKKEILSRSRSDTSVSGISQMSVHVQPQNSTGTISMLALADERLVSLHKTEGQELNSMGFHDSDFCGKLQSGMDSCSLKVQSGSSVRRSWASSQSSSTGIFTLRVADIAIWDKISWETLTTNRGYCPSNLT